MKTKGLHIYIGDVLGIVVILAIAYWFLSTAYSNALNGVIPNMV